MALDVYGCAMEQWRAHFPYKGGQTVWTYNEMAPVSSQLDRLVRPADDGFLRRQAGS